MAKSSGRAGLFEEPERIVKDHDPEALGPASDSGSEDGDENAGTEHYETVGKSKLRKSGGVSLGTEYRGARVSRNQLEEESDDDDQDDKDGEGSGSESEEYADPSLVNLEADEAEASDSEIDSDNALGESDEERFRGFAFRGSSKPSNGKGKPSKRAIAADFMSSDEEDVGAQAKLGSDEEEEDLSEDELNGSDEDIDDGLEALANGADGSEDKEDDDVDEDDDSDASISQDEDSQDEPRASKAAPAPGVNGAEIEKGAAIQKQRKLYDGLLNLRIRLQKALVAANTFPVVDDTTEPESEPYLAAEEAAVKLLNTISNLKDDFGAGARAGDKRKRSLNVSMDSEAIWQQLQADESKFVKFRQDRLNKWSRKVETVNVTTKRGLGSRNKSLTDALGEQLLDPENRLVKRTRVPRSCAPAQAAKKRVTEDQDIYDDADFYQLLLKELVDQRTVDNPSGSASAVPSVMLTASTNVRLRKNVDRKASKGRKMRFTVHEKLQNFMAPEDRRSWEQEAVDRFFGTLFGRKMELDEDDDESADDGVDDDLVDGLSADAEGLRLFK